MDSAKAKGSLYFYSGVFLTTFSTLALQIVQTRVLSVATWYYLAFFTISMAMFGLTAGAVWVYFRKERFPQNALSGHLCRHAALFSMAVCLSFAAQTTLALANMDSAGRAMAWVELAVVLAIPYLFSGIVVCLALTKSPYPVGKTYGADLLGAAAGCMGAFLLLNSVTAYSAVFIIGAAAAGGALCFQALAKIQGEPKMEENGPLERAAGKPEWALAAALLLAALNSLTGRGFEPIVVKERVANNDAVIYSGWNSFSNVRLKSLGLSAPKMWGPSRRYFEARPMIYQNYMFIDDDAGTAMYYFDGDKKSIDFLRYDITTLAHHLPRPKTSAAVIGVGGGRDLQAAHLFGFGAITGVDVNPIFINLLTREDLFANFAGLKALPGVRLINDEARSWFRRTDEKFDLIQMSLVDTWAATGAGAFTLTENSLYTLEGWECFLNRLNPDGVYTVSRWFNPGEMLETGRVASLAVAALLKTGARNPLEHIALADQGRLATIIISKRPFGQEDVKALKAAAEYNQYRWVIAPGGPAPQGALGSILSAKSAEELGEASSKIDLDMSPPTDDRPFFFNLVPLDNPILILSLAQTLRLSPEGNKGVVSGNVRAALSLFSIFIISLLLTLLTIVIPLRPAAADSGRGLVSGATWYFALIGFGFITVEMGVLQRFSVFLGHPIYSLSVSLFCLILSAGVGALLSERVRLESIGAISLWACLVSGYLALFGLFGMDLLWLFDGAPMAAKIALSAALISFAGLLLGFGFPAGMRLVSARDARPTPWLWGVNGACGVLGSSLAIWISLAFGISAVFLAGAAFYLGVIPAARRIMAAESAE